MKRRTKTLTRSKYQSKVMTAKNTLHITGVEHIEAIEVPKVSIYTREILYVQKGRTLQSIQLKTQIFKK